MSDKAKSHCEGIKSVACCAARFRLGLPPLWVIRVALVQPRGWRYVRFTSKSDQTLAPQRSGALCHEPTLSRRASLDHLIGTSEQCWRDRETQCLGRLEIDDHLELGRRLDGKV